MTTDPTLRNDSDDLAATDDILVIGEALIDIVKKATGEQKEHPGGSPANVAITLARLGRPAHLLTWFGGDERGDLIAAHLNESHVHLVDGSQSAERTPTAQATLDHNGSAQYTFDIEWKIEADLENFPHTAAAIHVGSIAAVLEPGAQRAAEIIEERRDTATITYDPNIRPALMGEPDEVRPLVEGLVGQSDVVKASDEDLEWLYPELTPDDVASNWINLGAGIVVITKGGAGATASTANHRVDIDAPPVHVVDTVGAGDSFMGALLDGLADRGLLGAVQRETLHNIGQDALTEIVGHAVSVAAITVSRAGANPPWLTELPDPIDAPKA